MAANNIINVKLIVGQSNPDGRIDGIPSVAEPDGTVLNIQMYNAGAPQNFAEWKYGTNGGAFTNTSVSYAFDVFALTAYRDLVEETLYVIKATRGGVSMAPDANNVGSISIDHFNIPDGATMIAYQLKERMERVRVINARLGFVTKFDCMLFHQGEGDADEPFASAYQANMTAFINQVRKWAWDANMPIIAGTVPTNSAAFSATVKTAQQNIAATDPNFHLIDLGSRALMDAYHWNAVETEAIGALYYNKMVEIL